MRLVLPCLALLLVGAAPVASDPRPDPDACQLLSNLDLEPLLFAGTGGTLDSQSEHPAPGMSTCLWEARPKGSAAEAKPRIATLAFYHLADRSTAQRQLGRQPHGSDVRLSTAMIAGDDDEVVRSSDTVLVARHGADMAVLDARGAGLSDPGQLEARYLLDALTLKAAGATVKSPPWVAPGTKAKWVPLDERSDAFNADVDWRPPANPSASTSSVADWTMHFALLVLRHGFLVLFAGIFGPTVVAMLLPSGARTGSARKIRIAWAVPVVIAALIANLVLGDALATWLLCRYGTATAATITGSYATSTQYNNHDVVGYHVMLRGPGGHAITTDFRDDDFNVYPPHNAVRYPGSGDVFTVRYLPRFPGDFTILANDGSPWALASRCHSLTKAVRQEAQRAVFSHADEDHAAWQAARHAATAAGCSSSD